MILRHTAATDVLTLILHHTMSAANMAEQYKEYVCTLTEASLKKARQELNEDPADRMNAVEAFRNLIKTRAPHIRCGMGKCVLF